MTTRTAEDERRAGIRDLIVGAVALVLMLGLWWLVARTNSEGTHDAELLPFIALIPLGARGVPPDPGTLVSRGEVAAAGRRAPDPRSRAGEDSNLRPAA